MRILQLTAGAALALALSCGAEPDAREPAEPHARALDNGPISGGLCAPTPDDGSSGWRSICGICCVQAFGCPAEECRNRVRTCQILCGSGIWGPGEPLPLGQTSPPSPVAPPATRR